MKLLNKVAIVTGAARGIGRATALAFAEAGADVALIDVNKADLQEVVGEIVQMRGRAMPLKVDISNHVEIENAVTDILGAFGKIDVLVNNAGVAIASFMETISIDVWDTVINTNLRGTFLFSRAVLPHMIVQSSGNIINVSSVDGMKGRAGGAAYCASKAGIIRFTESFADEVARYDIRVNVICPAGVNTPMWRKYHPDADEQSVLQPDDVADTILFLATDNSRGINGATIEMLGPRLEWASYL